MAINGIVVGLGLLAGVAFGPLALLIVLPILSLFHAIRGRIRVSPFVIAAICVLLGSMRGDMAPAPVPADDLAGSTGAIGSIAEIPVAGGEQERTILQVDSLRHVDDEWRDASTRVMIYVQGGSGISVGDRVQVMWSVTPVESLAPGYGRFVTSQNASASATVWSYEIEREGPAWLGLLSDIRRQTARSLEDVIPGDAGALAAGIVTGDDSGLSESAEHAFRKTGTSHITAVSGQNIALLIAFLALWMRPHRRATRIVTHVLMVTVVWAYAAMVGLEPPAMRAALVATLTILGTYSGRRPDPLTLLMLVLGAMAMIEPRIVDSVGFWLSASASWALCSVMHADEEPVFRVMVRQLLRGTVAASVATFPIIMWTFGEWSPISPLANVLIGPIMTFTFPAAYAVGLVAVIAPAVASLVAWIPGIGLDVSLLIVHRLEPVLPDFHLDMSGPAFAAALGIPLYVLLAAMGRDGSRWMGIVGRRLPSTWLAIVALVLGSVVGLASAVMIVAIL